MSGVSEQSTSESVLALLANHQDVAIVLVDDGGRVLFASAAAQALAASLIPKIGELLTSSPESLRQAGIAFLRLSGQLGAGGLSDAAAAGLSRQSRLESLGSIASGVAHDINNIVTGILGHLSYLRILLGSEGAHADSLNTIEEGAKRAASLSQQVLSFSRAAETNPVPVLCSKVIDGTVKLMRASIPAGCGLVFRATPEATRCMVLGIEAQLSQVVLNLIVNARDAVGNDGQIEVFLDIVSEKAELDRAFRGADLPSTQYARVIVADNGQGMSEEVRRRMFEPYFSTKKAHGTGLGLATVQQIVRQLGGAIVVDSTIGQGTTIAVYLPAMLGTAPLISGANSGITARAGVAQRLESLVDGHVGSEPVPQAREQRRLLIVDDEYSIRNVLCLSLEHLGYEVVVASGGREALEMYRDAMQGVDERKVDSWNTQPFDLVLLDMLMPDMRGDEVFRSLRKLDPEAPVMVVSGYAARESIEAVLEEGGLDYLPKPFTIEELAEKVRSCLAER